MARDMGITPGTEGWCGIWLCNLLSRCSRLPSPLFDNRPQKGRAGTEILAPKVTCRLLGGDRLVGSLGCEAKMASRQRAGRRRYLGGRPSNNFLIVYWF